VAVAEFFLDLLGKVTGAHYDAPNAL
jgi:hypothetical protein